MKDVLLGLAVGMIAGVMVYSCSPKSRDVVQKSKKAIKEKLKDIADSM